MIYHIYYSVGNESRDYLTFSADFGMFWVLELYIHAVNCSNPQNDRNLIIQYVCRILLSISSWDFAVLYNHNHR